ncbi:MAG: germination protein YpeB [Clostridia bacterium]|nr:germination protein YpeB [Clostridia bacterium]
MKKVSSGAEKAEELTRKKSTTKTTKKSADVKKKPATKTVKKTEKKVKKPAKKLTEKQIAKKKAREMKKAEVAKIKAEKKQRRLEKKLEAKQKRLDRIAALKEKRAERKEKRRERRDMLKHETKEARAKRVAEEKKAKIEARNAKREARAAERQAKREHRLKVRAEKRADRKERQHTPGLGGWLAAVIALGVTTLALGTMMTFGWIRMNGMEADMASIHMESVYELNSIVDNLDAGLSKARVSNSQAEQIKLLNEIAIDSEMAEVILERLPVDTQLTQNMTSFVNKMGDSAQSMLNTLARGGKLSESQKATLGYMYETNQQMKSVINEMTASASPKEIMNAWNGKDGNFMVKSFGNLENNTIETPKEINDGPFAENIKKVSAKNIEDLEEISATNAEELARKYFADYGLSDVHCTGEAVADQLVCYNLELKTKDGDMFAQLSKKGGKVVMFDSYKDCSQNNFSVERCIDIAEDFLNDLGIEGMKAVWTSENGTTCNLNFVYENDGVVFYPDMIKVKVCEERGIVTGMEGLAYCLNHTKRNAGEAEISKATAKSKLNSEFNVEGSRLTVIPMEGEEMLAYEFYGNYGENDYYIYIDAMTGEEIQVLTVVGTKQGKALM